MCIRDRPYILSLAILLFTPFFSSSPVRLKECIAAALFLSLIHIFIISDIFKACVLELGFIGEGVAAVALILGVHAGEVERIHRVLDVYKRQARYLAASGQIRRHGRSLLTV